MTGKLDKYLFDLITESEIKFTVYNPFMNVI